MMKTKIRRYLPLQLLLACTLLLSSCDETYWMIRDTSLVGYWRVVEVEPFYGECPYNRTDEFRFYSNGIFGVQGYGGLNESGYWDLDRTHIYFDFDGDGYDDMVADVIGSDGSYLALDVRDYSYQSRYRLRMVR